MKKIKSNPPQHTTKEVYVYSDEEREEIGRKNMEYVKSLLVNGTVKIEKKNTVLPCLDLLKEPEEKKKKTKEKSQIWNRF